MKRFCLVLALLLLAARTWAGELRCLRPGAPVISRYRDNRYFPGRVDGLGESIDVTFQNGQQQTYSSFSNDVIVDDIPDPSELAGGSRVLARRPSSTSFEPGFVNGSIAGLPLNDTYLVNYDTGDSIARNIGDIRLAVKPRSCMNEKGIYIGCFENVINNFLTNYYPVNPTDVATCNWACFTRGFRFAGLQNGTWCFCGNHVNDSLKVDDNDCNIACRDSREDVCGGYQRMTVYWTGADFPDNSTNDFSEFADATDQVRPVEDRSKYETSSTDGECSDLHDSTQCNAWADQSKCIENPDWMLVNCKKSCYACSYDDHSQDTSQDKSDPNLQSYTPDSSTQPQSQSQINPYESPAQTGYQASSSYAQNPYLTSQDGSTQSSAKKSDHPVLDSTSNIPGYLGCFKDSPTSHDLEYLADIRPLSIRACVTKCKSMRFPYAGVQSTTLCYCGLHYGNYGQLEHEDCNTPCEADASEMCGGIFKNSLYHTGFPVKFKSAENALTRKNLASSSSALERAFTGSSLDPSRVYESNPNYPSQFPQPSYLQPNPSYNPPVYPQPSSLYTQAAIPGQSGYPLASTTQTNGYQPAYSYNTQVNNPIQAGISTASADTRGYSPEDSSSYRWRETYVKLRQQEQERYSKPNLRNLRILQKKQSTWSEIPRNSAREHRVKAKAKDSSKFHNLGNYAKLLSPKESKPHSVKSTDTLTSQNHSPAKSLYSQFISQVYKNARKSGGNRRVLKKGTKRHKHFGKPGVFLRTKASKKNSFLAFLPHEVTEDESLLENVYNMLSVMLKNLRKHKKSSMNTLKKYLKLSTNEDEMSKYTRKAPLHAAQSQEWEDRPEKSLERKFKGMTEKHKSQGLGRSSQHFDIVEKHPSKGQKQLSKQGHEISNLRRHDAQAMTYTTHGLSRLRQDVNQTLTNENSADIHHITNEAKSTLNSNKDYDSLTNIPQTHENGIGKVSQSQQNKNISSNAFQQQIKLASTVKRARGDALSSEVHRNKLEVVTNKENPKPVVDENTSENHRPLPKVRQKVPQEYKNSSSKSSEVSERQDNVLKDHENTTRYNGRQSSRFVEIGNPFQQNMKHETSFERNKETNNASLDVRKETLLKASQLKQKHKKGSLKKLRKLNSPSSMADDRASLNIDTAMAKKQTDEESMVEASNNDIISTIVDLLDEEKSLRKMEDQKKQRKQDDRKSNQRKSKRKSRRSRKRKHKVKNKERKHKIRTRHSRNNKLNRTDLKRMYKKDRVERVNDDDNENYDENLMEQEENFKENDKMNGDEMLKY